MIQGLGINLENINKYLSLKKNNFDKKINIGVIGAYKIEKGYLDNNKICTVSTQADSMLTFPEWDKADITRLRDVFAMYIKFPKNRWPEIKEAETNAELREELRQEFIKTYWGNVSGKIEDDIAEAAKGLF